MGTPEINPCLYGQITFDKVGMSIHGVKIVSLVNGLGRTGVVHAKIMKLDQYFTPYNRINSKCIKDLNVLGSMKILVENIGSKISDIPCSNIFAYISTRARGKRGKIKK